MKKTPGTGSSGSFADLFESTPGQVGLRRCAVGDVLDLEVVGVGEDAILVALDGKQEGVIDRGELTGPDGRPTVSVGSRVAARVVEIERATGTVRLSPVSTEPIVQGLAPEAVARADSSRDVVVGMRVRGKVSGVERYGVFLEFDVAGESRSRRGLVPVGELGTPRGADLRKTFPLGRELEAVVTSIDDRGRLRLSVTALAAADERKAYEAYAASGKENASRSEPKESGFGTLGDLLKRRT